MGDVIRLAERRAARVARDPRAERAPRACEFLFDLCCPFSYLAAERVDRIFDHVVWTPASTSALLLRFGGDRSRRPGRLPTSSAERRAAELRLPLIWPERFPEEVPAAMRAASYAAEQGRGAAFVLAAGRLAFCGGFDLDDPELLAEAAAAAGIDMDGWLRALGEVAPRRRDRGGGPRACWRRARTGCRRCASGARCSGASTASTRRPLPPVSRPRARPAALRADEPGEDLASISSSGAWSASRISGRIGSSRSDSRRSSSRSAANLSSLGVVSMASGS